MVNTPISMSTVWRRKNYLLDSREQTNVNGLFSNAINAIENKQNSSTIREYTNLFLKSCSSKTNSTYNFDRCMLLFEALYNNGNQDILNEAVLYFTKNVIPYCTSYSDINESVARLDQANQKLILSEVDLNKRCDRLLNNHNKLSKRFKVDSLFENKLFNLEDTVYCVKWLIPIL